MLSPLMNWVGNHPFKCFAITSSVAIGLLLAGLIPPNLANVMIIVPGFRAVFAHPH